MPASPQRSLISTPPNVYEPPVCLFASQTVQSNANAQLTAKALSNLTGRPIDIHEIRFGATVSSNAVKQIMAGGSVKVRINFAGAPITSGDVPMWCFAPTRSLGDEESYSSGASVSSSRYVMKLAQPLHVPAGMSFDVAITHTGAMPQPIIASVAFAGRIVGKQRTKTRVPYVAAYVSKSMEYNAADSDASAETDLTNSTCEMVRIERLIGRLSTLYAAATPNDQPNFYEWLAATSPSLFTLKLIASQGQFIVRDATPWREAFSGVSNSLESGFLMPPGSYLTAFLTKATGTGLGSAAAFIKQQAYLSIVGWREVDLVGG